MATADTQHLDRLADQRQELGAIVQATEAATNIIMECAEMVLAADPADPEAYRTLVEEKMLAVFEACSFQDITGQRIARVVETLQNIEDRVTRFACATHAADKVIPLNDDERARAERRRRLLLHGPQPAGYAQREVDLLFKNGSGKAAQSDIDAPFD